MKALTIRQPWAQLIAIGAKTIETRSRATHHRGPTVIHAGMDQSAVGIDFWKAHGNARGGAIYSALGDAGVAETPYYSYDDRKIGLPLGAIVAVVELVGCLPIIGDEDCAWHPEHPFGVRAAHAAVDGQVIWHTDDAEARYHTTVRDEQSFGDFTPGRWAWLLADVRQLDEPIPCRGAQGLWNVPADIEAQITGRAA